MPDSETDTCTRCGKMAAGRRRLMFYSHWEWLFGSAIRNEFYCLPCWRIIRVYSIIGLSLLRLMVIAILVVLLWLWLKP